MILAAFRGLILSFGRLIDAYTSGSIRSPKIDSGVGLTQFSNT